MKKAWLFSVLAAVLNACPGLAAAQSSLEHSWTETWGGTEYDRAESVTTDLNGNVYVAGSFDSTGVDFDPGTGTDSHSSSGSSDVFLTKYNSDGSYAWTRTWGGISNDYGYGVAVDQSGGVYVVGQFAETVDFDPGEVTENYTSYGSFDVFLCKYDSSGNYVWTRRWGGGNYDTAGNVAADGNGNVYVAGYFQGTADFDPGLATDNHSITPGSESGSVDPFLSKFNTDGVYAWAKTFGGTNGEEINGLTCDPDGNIYLAGYFTGSTDFDPGAGTDILIANGSTDAFLSKYDSAGTYSWVKAWGGDSSDLASDVTCDENGNIYVAGAFRSTVDFDPEAGEAMYTSAGSYDGFVTKFSSAGTYLWTGVWGGTSEDSASSVSVNSSGMVYVGGSFEDTADFDPGSALDSRTSNGSEDAFITIYDGAGNYSRAKTWGGTSGDRVNSSAVDSDLNVYLAGQFNSTVDFNPPADEETHTSNGSADAFLMSFLPDYCADDSAKTEAGICGCGVPDTDLNGSGTADCLDPDIAGVRPPKAMLSQRGRKVTARLTARDGIRYVVTYKWLTGNRAKDRKARNKTLTSLASQVLFRGAKAGRTLIFGYRYEIGVSPVTKSLESKKARFLVR